MTKAQYILTTLLAALAVVLALLNGVLLSTNQTAQAELAQKQGYLQQTGQLEGIYTNIATSLAQLALKDNDRALIDMLGSLGLKVTPNPAPATAAAVEKP
ncbi:MULTISPECIES: hypothetical protein [Roseateles]|uniref:Cell division protein FtsL n=1 Tax=Roseateles albus TaxID=2987525 RepID=A0ABT5KDE9_9BURK|nr:MULTISPECIES: hypothetical protein [Roseateles]MCV2360339.1 hypothetical protein [Paucibacter sp. TC2R-5]MDC8771954.1 hypothetical protein [Roseateles albus]